ncbi:DUF1636 family protein [Roseibium sp.]|uniref:DUF1636 family protein n=1 Tax=Roseibium sp. TaxID=1936156 RepID=UPI003D13113F
MRADRHKIRICTSCRHKGETCRQGFDLLQNLQLAVKLAAPVTGDDFEVSGTVRLEGCPQPCFAVYRASEKEACFFGGVEPDADIDHLVSIAQTFKTLEQSGYVSAWLPGQPQAEGLAKVPAAMIVTVADGTAFS